MKKFVIAIYVDNRYGVLTRVTSMFTRRGFNIDALTVGETESPEYSRITICLSGDGYARDAPEPSWLQNTIKNTFEGETI